MDDYLAGLMSNPSRRRFASELDYPPDDPASKYHSGPLPDVDELPGDLPCIFCGEVCEGDCRP